MGLILQILYFVKEKLLSCGEWEYLRISTVGSSWLRRQGKSVPSNNVNRAYDQENVLVRRDQIVKMMVEEQEEQLY